MSHKLSEKLHKLSLSEAVNHEVRPDTDDHLGSTTYLKYEANNVILLRSRVLC